MIQKELYDSAVFRTTDMNAAVARLKSLSAALEVIKVKTTDIKLISYVGENPDGSFQVAYSSPPVPTDAKINRRAGLPVFYKMERKGFTRNGLIDEEFINEFKKNGYALSIRDVNDPTKSVVYICSSSVLGTLCTRCNVSGDGLFINTVLRDQFLAERLFFAKKNCHVIMRRSNDGVPKVFAVLGSAYTPISQEIVVDVVQKCSEDLEATPELVNFVSDNFITRMYVEFPDISDDFAKTYKLPDKVSPGICVSTSDTGDSSLTVWGTVRIGKCTTSLFFGEYARKHSGEIDLEEIIENIRKNVFSEFTKAPETLLKLLSIDIKNPKKVIEKVINTTKLKKLLGKDNSVQLIEALQAEIDDHASYTAYDIATMIMSAPERTEGLAPGTLLVFQKNAKEALFADYENIEKKSSLYLTA